MNMVISKRGKWRYSFFIDTKEDTTATCPMNLLVPLTRKYQVQSRKKRYFWILNRHNLAVKDFVKNTFMFLCMTGIMFLL